MNSWESLRGGFPVKVVRRSVALADCWSLARTRGVAAVTSCRRFLLGALLWLLRWHVSRSTVLVEVQVRLYLCGRLPLGVVACGCAHAHC